MHIIGNDLYEIFHALSDNSRLRMVKLLLKAKDELCLCELSDSLDEPEYKLSRHLKILKSAGLLSSTREGKWIYHSLVKHQKFLRLIYSAIEMFPEADESKQDFQRFKKRKNFTNSRSLSNSAKRRQEGYWLDETKSFQN